MFCSGKVYYDLLEQRRANEQQDVAIVRIEQLYPFPLEEVQAAIANYTNVVDYVWCQEEPQTKVLGTVANITSALRFQRVLI